MTSDPALRPPLDSARLGAAHPALRIEVVDAAPSTNALVVERAKAGEVEGLVVVAEHQTAGRGRLDRTWETPPRTAITFSLLLRPTVATASWPWLPLLTGYAVDRALQTEGYASAVKWPNDVLIGDRKVAGILVERIDTPDGPAAVVGVGLNAGMSEAELPVATATSLAVASGEEPDRTRVLIAVLGSVQEAYAAWQADGRTGGERLRTAYATACVTVGQDVRVELPSGGVLTGPATGVDPGGRLVVQGPTGETAVGAGDVIHVRAVQK